MSGPIYPGRPGESLQDFVGRREAEFVASCARFGKPQAPPLPRESDVMGLPRGGPGWGS